MNVFLFNSILKAFISSDVTLTPHDVIGGIILIQLSTTKTEKS